MIGPLVTRYHAALSRADGYARVEIAGGQDVVDQAKAEADRLRARIEAEAAPVLQLLAREGVTLSQLAAVLS